VKKKTQKARKIKDLSFAFGTIPDMQNHPLRIRIHILVLMIILSACTASPDGRPASGIPTPDLRLTSNVPTQSATQSGVQVTPQATNQEDGTKPAPQASPTSTVASNIDPLTGLPPADPSLLQRRPLAITVTNHPSYVRPQAGLTLADVVFQYYEEPFYTRFMAVFYGNTTNMIGPVRSGRYFNEHIVRMYHAFFAFQYADPREINYFMSGDLHQFLVLQGYGNCPPYFNSNRHIELYNNAYFDLTKWNDCATQNHLDNSPQNIRSTLFSPSPPASTFGAERIYTSYSIVDYNYWQYDPASGRYLRYDEASDMPDNKPRTYIPLTDYLNGRQVTADNVVVLFVPHTFMNENEQEDQVFHIDLIDSGNAYVFRNGEAIPAFWMRTDINQPLVMTNLDGSPIPMKPGQTFFEVIGETSSHRMDGTNWYFEYQTP
jgi:hypothetical protein